MEKQEIRNRIAKRVAAELQENTVVNLGIGIPTLVCAFIPDTKRVILQSENGFVGMGENAFDDAADPQIINASGMPVTLMPGAAFFDSAMSFVLIRGGHVSTTVLGTLQVDQEGSVANWIIPGKLVPGIGGAMDLISGSKQVIIATEHTVKDKPKIVKKCTLPLTAYARADMIVSEKAVFIRDERGLVLSEFAPEENVDTIRACTEAEFIVADNLKEMPV